MTTLNIERSKALAKKIRAQPQSCWNNAFRGMNKIPGALYVEGYMTYDNGFVTEHGWLEDGDDIIDPTIDWLHNAPAHYVPGLKFTFQQLVAACENKREELHRTGEDWRWILPIANNGFQRSTFPEYQRAESTAYEWAGRNTPAWASADQDTD